jgi:outer membrane protein
MMSMKIKAIAIFLLILALNWCPSLMYGERIAARAYEGEGREGSTIYLTLEEAINLALKANRNLLISQYSLESQKLSLKSALSEFELKIMPATTLGVTGSDSESDESLGLGLELQRKFQAGTSLSVEPSVTKDSEYRSGVGISINQPLLRGFGREVNLAGIRNVEYSARTSERNLYQTMVNTVLETVSAVYQVIKQEELVRLNEALASRLLHHADAARIKEKIGLATPMDVYRAEIRLKDVQDSLSSSKQDLQDAKDQVKIILALPLESDLDFSAPLEYTPIRLSQGDAVEIARKNRVELEQAEDEIRQAQRNSRIAKHNILPKLNVVLNYNRFGSSDDFGESTGLDEASWGIQLVSSTDVSRTSEKAAYQQSMVNLETARLNRDARQDEIYRQVRMQLVALEAVEKRIMIRRDKVTQAEGKMSLATIKFSYGMANNFDLIEAEQELLQARVDMLSARIDYVKGIYSLRAVLGTLIERKLGFVKF